MVLTVALTNHWGSGSVTTAPWVGRHHPPSPLTLTLMLPGPPEVKDECGTPILCMFYGLLFFIICLTIYSTARGTKE